MKMGRLMVLVPFLLASLAWGSGFNECQEIFNPRLQKHRLALASLAKNGLTKEEVLQLPPSVPRRLFDLALKNTRKIDEINELKIFEFNVENLFLRHVSLLRANQQPDKPAKELEGVARIIKNADPDILVLPEVDSQFALSEFNKRYLNEGYRPLLLEGNDSRGIDIGILIKADLPFDVEMRSFSDAKEADGDPIFSRDLPTWIFREAGSNPKSRPLFVVAGTHYKSLRGSKKDPTGEKKRELQAEKSTEILLALDQEFGGVPIILTGDFNNEIHQSPEFKSLFKAGFEDSLTLTGQKPQPTQAYFKPDGTPAPQQIDSIMLNASFQKLQVLLKAVVLPHLDKDNRPLPFPRTFDERETRASDHVPSMVVLAFQKLRLAWANLQ